MIKYWLVFVVFVHEISRCWKSLKIAWTLINVSFVYDNVTVPSDFLAWLTSLHFSSWWFTCCCTIAMVVLSSSLIMVDIWNVSYYWDLTFPDQAPFVLNCHPSSLDSHEVFLQVQMTFSCCKLCSASLWYPQQSPCLFPFQSDFHDL